MILEKWLDNANRELIPLQASLELTYKCNQKCGHCYVPLQNDDHNEILDYEKWKKILCELRQAGTLYLILTGGEPMLSPAFWDVSKRAAELGFFTSLITNGLLINKKVAREFRRIGMSNITFSLYSLDSSIHDGMTLVEGSLDRTLSAIDWCLKENLKIGINCLLTKINVEKYYELEDWCTKKNIEIRFDLDVTPKFNGDLRPIFTRATENQQRDFFNKQIKRWPNSISELESWDPEDCVCNAGKGKCAVTAFGQLLPCIDIRDPLGDLTKNSFQSLWYSQRAEKWRSIKYKNLKNLTSKDEITKCCYFCPGAAVHESGSEFIVPDFHLKLRRIKMEEQAKSDYNDKKG